MYQRILVPFDASSASTQALQEALRLAKQTGAQLRVIHVVHEFVLGLGDVASEYGDELFEALSSSGARVLARAEPIASAAGVECETQLIEAVDGSVSELIVKAARDWPADLIVMGTHGRRGMKRVLMGSDAEMVLRSAPVPLLLVKGEEALPV